MPHNLGGGGVQHAPAVSPGDTVVLIVHSLVVSCWFVVVGLLFHAFQPQLTRLARLARLVRPLALLSVQAVQRLAAPEGWRRPQSHP